MAADGDDEPAFARVRRARARSESIDAWLLADDGTRDGGGTISARIHALTGRAGALRDDFRTEDPAPGRDRGPRD